MRLTVPYIFEGRLTYSRNRKNELSSFQFKDVHFASLEIDIPVASEAEAPLAVEASVLVHRMTHSWREVAFRYYNGRFYTTDRLSPEGPGNAFRAEMLGQGACPYDSYDRHPIMMAYEGTQEGPCLPLFGWSEAKNVVKSMLEGWKPVVPKSASQWDRREECRAAAMQALSTLLIVDGEVWRAVPEPKLLVNVASYNIVAEVRLSTETGMGVSAFSNARSRLSADPVTDRYFQMGDMEAVRELVRSTGHGLDEHVRDIAVHMPEVLTADTGMIMLAKAASDFLVKTSGTLHASSDGHVAAWLSLRRELHRAQIGEGDEMELARCLSDAIGRRWAVHAVNMASAALAAYDEMPVSLRPKAGQVLVPR